MKLTHLLKKSASMAALVLVLGGAEKAQGADDFIVNQFNTDTEVTQWTRWWGNATQTFTWDAAKDSSNNAASGSLKVEIGFSPALGGENQFSIYKTFGSVDGAQYTNLALDIWWDSTSPTRGAGGDYGWLEIGIVPGDYSQTYLTAFAVRITNEWMRLNLPISPTLAKLESTIGVTMKMWSGQAGQQQDGTARFWVDNIRLIGKVSTNDPAPTLSIEKPNPGLKIAASGGGQYQRQSIRTTSPEYSFMGGFDPVTYSITLKEYPNDAHTGFQTHLFIVPGPLGNNNDPDWNQPNVIFLNIGNYVGGANATFRYKTNQANGNGMFYGAGAVASVNSSTAVGTWNLTFNPNGGGISLTSPSGASTNFTLPPEVEALFNGPAYAYFGVQPNQLSNLGEAVVFGQIQITGVVNPIDETFSSATLDPARWQVQAESPTGLSIVPADAFAWLSWTVPDRGFTPQYATDLTASNWGPLAVVAPQIGTTKKVLLTPSNLPESTTSNYFFRLLKTQ